jgi:uncharacterized SAM-binding protein YcdF (DUF218 family)
VSVAESTSSKSPIGPVPSDSFGELAGQPRRPSRFRKWLWRIVALLVVALAAYALRAPILRGVANAYVVDDPVAKADAVVVLGGGANTRPFAAAKLFHEGYAPRVLVMNTEREPTDELGVTTPDSELNRRVLRALKVPDAAITAVGRDVASTHDEAMAVRDWAQRNGAKRVIVPTDLFHTRRVNWLFSRTLNPIGAKVCVRAIPDWKFSTTNWWQHENGLVSFQNEAMKLALYWCRY